MNWHVDFWNKSLFQVVSYVGITKGRSCFDCLYSSKSLCNYQVSKESNVSKSFSVPTLSDLHLSTENSRTSISGYQIVTLLDTSPGHKQLQPKFNSYYKVGWLLTVLLYKHLFWNYFVKLFCLLVLSQTNQVQVF